MQDTSKNPELKIQLQKEKESLINVYTASRESAVVLYIKSCTHVNKVT